MNAVTHWLILPGRLDVCTSDRLAWHLFTVEGMRLLRERLAAGGILAIQFIGDDGPWSASLSCTVNATFGESLMLSAAVDIAPVGPRWLLAGRDYPARLPEAIFASSEDRLPWRTVTVADEGALLTDDHFPAELHWARVARQWRSLYTSSP